MDSETLDQPCTTCEMSHGHHAAWCKSSTAAPGFAQGVIHSDLHPATRLKPSPAGINAEGAKLSFEK